MYNGYYIYKSNMTFNILLTYNTHKNIKYNILLSISYNK